MDAEELRNIRESLRCDLADCRTDSARINVLAEALEVLLQHLIDAAQKTIPTEQD